MKYLRLDGGENLDEAYAKLIQMEADMNRNTRGKQTVYMVFNGKRIVSNQSLNEAYKDVYGFSKDDLMERDRQRKIAAEEEEEEETKVYAFTPREVVDDINISILIEKKDPITGNWISAVADSYLADMYKYTKYCKKITEEHWKTSILDWINNIGKKDKDKKLIYTDEEIISKLEFYEKLGIILKAVTIETPWSEVKSLVDSYNLSDEDKEKLKELMCFYSIKGEEFVINVFGKGPMTYKNN